MPDNKKENMEFETPSVESMSNAKSVNQLPQFEDTEFATPTPTQQKSNTRFEYDRHITPEAKTLKFVPKGESWVRILPKMKQSQHMGWMYPFEVYRFPVTLNNKKSSFAIAHPKVKDDSQTVCLIDQVRYYLSKNNPDWIQTKANRHGFCSFRSTPVTALNMLVYTPREGGGHDLQYKIWTPSYNDGEYGKKGIGYQIKEYSDTLQHSIAHSQHGRMIKITQVQADGYIDYQFTPGNEKPINDLLSEMDQEEIDAIIPLEDIVRKPSALDMSLAIRDCIGIANWVKLVNEMNLPRE